MTHRHDPKEFSSDAINENQIKLNEMDWSREEPTQGKVVRMASSDEDVLDDGEDEWDNFSDDEFFD